MIIIEATHKDGTKWYSDIKGNWTGWTGKLPTLEEVLENPYNYLEEPPDDEERMLDFITSEHEAIISISVYHNTTPVSVETLLQDYPEEFI